MLSNIKFKVLGIMHHLPLRVEGNHCLLRQEDVCGPWEGSCHTDVCRAQALPPAGDLAGGLLHSRQLALVPSSTPQHLTEKNSSTQMLGPGKALPFFPAIIQQGSCLSSRSTARRWALETARPPR